MCCYTISKAPISILCMQRDYFSGQRSASTTLALFLSHTPLHTPQSIPQTEHSQLSQISSQAWGYWKQTKGFCGSTLRDTGWMYGKRACMHTLLVTIIDQWVTQLSLLYLQILTIKTVIAIMMTNEWMLDVLTEFVIRKSNRAFTKLKMRVLWVRWRCFVFPSGSTQLIKCKTMQTHADVHTNEGLLCWCILAPIQYHTPDPMLTHSWIMQDCLFSLSIYIISNNCW